MYCKDCGEQIDSGAAACPACGAANRSTDSGPLLPAVLSFLLPGLGQLFLGRGQRAGAVFLAALFGSYVLFAAGGIALAVAAPALAAYDAYRLAAAGGESEAPGGDATASGAATSTDPDGAAPTTDAEAATPVAGSDGSTSAAETDDSASAAQTAGSTSTADAEEADRGAPPRD